MNDGRTEGAIAAPAVPEIDRDELGRAGDGVVLLDVRPREAYRGGHIPGAVSLPVHDIPARAPELLPEREAAIVAYCTSDT
ncbi:MAG TPA: rhodanese-like domain-containing protein [Candidatus Binatia bacterium]|nr:rhodanese-like domain-containing protein [Candidatus Binatia bacterium]